MPDLASIAHFLALRRRKFTRFVQSISHCSFRYGCPSCSVGLGKDRRGSRRLLRASLDHEITGVTKESRDSKVDPLFRKASMIRRQRPNMGSRVLFPRLRLPMLTPRAMYFMAHVVYRPKSADRTRDTTRCWRRFISTRRLDVILFLLRYNCLHDRWKSLNHRNRR